mgnify:FL=1|tara:strand:+ start:904 stop:1806 length:903 start_codon:yes stop_codon:yes gene_type:complete
MNKQKTNINILLIIMKTKQNPIKKGLYIVATPIGNLQDISFRAVDILKHSNLILCENPRHSLKLLNELKIKKKLISIHDYNEVEVIRKISKNLKNSIISLISDAGSPMISDPGFKLIQHCIKENIFITSVPGASSIISSLQLSGIPNNIFSFFGFIPKKRNQALLLLESCKDNKGAQIFLTSAHKLVDNLKLIEKIFNNRKVAICKELTKINEQILRTNSDKITEIVKNKDFKIKGEFVIILEGGGKKSNNVDKKVIESLDRIAVKFSLTESVKIVHKLTELSKNELYKVALKKIKNKDV